MLCHCFQHFFLLFDLELELELEREHQEYEDLTAKYDLLEEDYVVIKGKMVLEKDAIQKYNLIIAGINSAKKLIKYLFRLQIQRTPSFEKRARHCGRRIENS